MKFHYLRNKLLLTVAVLVIGSGLIISLLEANRFSKSLRRAAIAQGEYLSRAVALASKPPAAQQPLSIVSFCNQKRQYTGPHFPGWHSDESGHFQFPHRQRARQFQTNHN